MAYEAEIASAAAAQGIPATIPLAVAWRESGRKQYNADGTVRTGGAGELGIFQVKPATAPGVNLADPMQNIQAGVGYLARLFSQYHKWDLALAAYNWGPQNVDKYQAGKIRSIPAGVQNYVKQVLGGVVPASWTVASPATYASASGPAKGGNARPQMVALGLLGAGLLLVVALR